MRPRNRYVFDSCYSWVICTVSTISNGVLHSVVLSFGVFLPELMREFNQNREKTAMVGSLVLAIAYFLCIFGGKLCQRYGCQRIHIIGTLTCALSLFITSWATGLTYMYLSFCVLYGIGFCFTLVPCFLLLNEYFRKRHSMAVGIVTAGASAAFFIFGPILQSLIDSIGWRNCYRVQSGLSLGCCCFSYLFKTNVKKTDIQDHLHDRRRCISEDSQPRKILDCSIWKIPGFTIPVISFVFVTFGHYSPAIHLVRRLEEVGLARKRSSYLFIAIGVGSLLTRIAAGKICEYIRPIRVNQMAVLCSAISTLLLSTESSYVVLVVLALLYGLADGAFLTTYNVILLSSVDVEKRPIAYGMGNMATAVSVAVGPMVTGLIADHYSYCKAFLVTGSVTLAGFLVTLALFCFKNPGKKEHIPFEDQERVVICEMVTVV